MSKPSNKRAATVAVSSKRLPGRAIVPELVPTRPRDGSKGSLVIDKLSMPKGASIAELMAATDWLSHTTRAALTGLRKRGFAIMREPDQSGTSRYRIQTEQAKSRPKRKGGAGLPRHDA